MAKKRNPRNKKPAVQKTPAMLEQEALHFFEKRQYKEAINAYKTLLKTENREDWQQQLLQSYLLRGTSIAEKGLYQEAAVLWENSLPFNQHLQQAEDYLHWLSCCKQYVKIADFLKREEQRLDKSQLQYIHGLLGAALLAGEKDILPLFSQDHPLLAHYRFASDALQAYCRHDETALEDSLKQIPFRSPYKDFRSILKALVLLESDRDGAMAALAKFSEDSPYAGFIRLCQVQGLDDAQKLGDYATKLHASEQVFIQKLSGLDDAQAKLLKNSLRVLTHYSDKQALELVMKNSRLFGDEKTQRFGLELLPHYPAGKRLLQSKGFLPQFEAVRLKALSFEKDQHFADALPHWFEYLGFLKERNLPEEHLKTALVMRHAAKLSGEGNISICIRLLQDSLELDPDDRDSYLLLILLLKQKQKTDELRQWLDKALLQYPEDVEILTANIVESMERSAFKKAAGFAKRILKIDPINPQARGALVSCHAAHARKLIKQGKLELAEKELAQAKDIDQGKYKNGLILILQGLLAFKKGAKDDCKSLVDEGKSLERGELCGQLRLHIEILNLGLPSASVLRLCSKLDKDYIANPDEIMELAAMLTLYQQRGSQSVGKAFEKIKAVFKKSFKAGQREFSQQQFITLCQQFDELENFEILRLVSNAAVERGIRPPVLLYYRVYAKTNGDGTRMDTMSVMHLRHVLDLAYEQKDSRTASKVVELLDDYESQYYPEHYHDEDDDYDFDDLEAFDAVQRLMENIGNMEYDELFQFVFNGKQPTPQQIQRLQRTGEEGFNQMLMERILEEAGIDKRAIEGIDFENLLFGNH